MYNYNLIERIISLRKTPLISDSYKFIAEESKYLQFLTSEHHWDDSLKEDDSIPTNPIRRIESAFNAVGRGQNPISGEPMPTYGTRAYKDVIKTAHKHLREKHEFGDNTIRKILSGNQKLQHSTGKDILTPQGQSIFSQGLELSPAHSIRGVNTCPKATKIYGPNGELVGGCAASCLGKTAGGNMIWPVKTAVAKLKKTNALFDSPEHFAVAVNHHIEQEKREAAESKPPYKYAVRMNVTSDIPQKAYLGLRQKHPEVQFYDYTKEPKQMMHSLEHKQEPGWNNLHLTFSSTGVHHNQSNWEDARKVLKSGGNVAMVFDAHAPRRMTNVTKQNPRFYYPGKEKEPKYALPSHVHDVKESKHIPVINGDFDRGDARFLDPPGHIVGLYKKGFSNFGSFAVPFDKEKKVATVKD